jgi:hypothetical protein
MALRETYDRALIANQIGDYPRALAELQDLAANTTLNPRQQQAVQDLLAQIKKAAPDLVATNALLASAAIKPEPPAEFPLASATATESTKNAADFAFSTADPSVRESFARAKAAFDIGDYPKALDELTDLSTNAQLNSQQKYAVQVLLGKTPQSLPAVTTPANPPPSPKP